MTTDMLKNIWPDWEIVQKIGNGGYAVVYEAVKRSTIESRAAIKVISIPSDSSLIDTLRSEGLSDEAIKATIYSEVESIENEIIIMLKLKGLPNIVSIEDYKIVEKQDSLGWDIYIRMELLTPLEKHFSCQKPDEQKIIQLGCDICAALEYCEKLNIIHRDIKPVNILVDNFGNFKLSDFGISKIAANNTVGSLRYTPDYAAPEVVRYGKCNVTTDLYSLGLVMYRYLNRNRMPFLDVEKQIITVGERVDAFEKRLEGTEKFKKPCDASPEMADLILRACAYDPDMRFTSATEMKNALISVANGTYRIEENISNLDKTRSVRPAPANDEKIISVSEGLAVTDRKPVQTVDTFGKSRKKEKTRKKKKRLKIVVAAVLLLMGFVCAGGYAIEHKNRVIANIISEAETLAAVENYEDALTKVQIGMEDYPGSEKLQTKADEYTGLLNAQVKKLTLAEAETLAESGDYVAAMDLIKNAQDTYGDNADYHDAYASYNDAYIAAIINEADALAKNGDYPGAIQTIEETISAIGENSELTAKITEYKSMKENADIEDVLDSAKSYADDNDYKSALTVLNNALESYPDNASLRTQHVSYQESYAKSAIAEADEYININDYDTAINILLEAMELLPNNSEISEKIQKTKDKRPIELRQLKSQNGSYFWWTNDAAEDVFGNVYSGNNVVRISDIWSNGGGAYLGSCEFYTGGNYDTFICIVVPETDSRSNSAVTFDVYADGNLKYSTVVTQKTEPTIAKVDIKGASWIQIESNSIDGTRDAIQLIINNASLIKAD